MKTNFCTRKKWVRTDAWRGYEIPIYAVAGANDTGMWSDSPCPSNVCSKELDDIQKQLRAAHILSRRTVCRSSNVFCIHRYLICSPDDVERGREVVQKFLNENYTRLSYLVN
jgi:hypothetical protein